MRTQPELREREQARVVGSVGVSEPVTPGEPIAADNLGELLAVAPHVEDRDRWFHTPEERYRILRSLLLADGSPWLARFGFLLAMSIVIASLGLANNQPAAVIAAMVVAPMMTPVLGIAASMMLGLGHRTIRLVLIVAGASVMAVAISWTISAILVVHEVTAEELSRTTPRLRDLVIALAAGSAGMYSIVRKDLSGVLPGVAIAVALVPPLATVGILLELNEWSLARGAALLYVVNVIAIILAALVVLLVTDFIASPSVRDRKMIGGTVFLLLSGVAIIVPLWLNSRRIDREAIFREHVTSTVSDWTTEHPGYHVVSKDIDPGEVALVLSGTDRPPEVDDLHAALANDDYTNPDVEVVWFESTVVDPAG